MNKKKLLQYVLPVAVVATIAATEANAGGVYGQLEEDVMSKTSTFDVKVGNTFKDGFGYFTRARIGLNDEKKVSTFALLDVSKNIYKGFDLLQETQLIDGEGIVPRIGGQYFKQVGPFGTYAAATQTLKGTPSIEATITETFEQPLSKKVSLRVFAEAVAGNSWDGEIAGLDYAVARIRAGVKMPVGSSSLEMGPALDVSQGSKPLTGAYLRLGL